MKNIDYVVKLYFHNVSAYNIFHGHLKYESFDETEFMRLMFIEKPDISESETEELHSYLNLYREKRFGENGLNVFRTLKEIAKEFLEIRDNQPICRYDLLVSWRELVESTDEDLMICAFLAEETEKTGRLWGDFAWNPVIGHDNVQLNRIMQRGISDNHFHLFGSTQLYQLVWIRLMNDFEREEYVTALQEIDKDQRLVGTNYSKLYREESLVQLRFKAGIIRAYLVSYIDKATQGILVEKDEVKKQQEIQRVLESDYNYFEYYAYLEEYLEGRKLMDLSRYTYMVEDYACDLSHAGKLNWEFAGERRLVYQMLLGQVNGVKISDKLKNWFYAYLVIKIKFRGEFVQENSKVGFENFSRYSRRKSGFLDKPMDMERMIKYAVGGSVITGNIRSLELRISPEKTAAQNRQYICKCDECIKRNLGENVQNNTYYVFHFPKKADKQPDPNQTGFTDQFRHYEYRTNVERTAEQIVEFRERYQEEAARVLGIDACAQELYCRPEVFASAFRMLSNHVVHNTYGKPIGQLKITYHVGEDWYDIVDGLRAIDEAVSFLGMKNGDRMGHATVLGIDVEDWYEKKKGNLWISLQNYLDNVVWLYYKLNEFDIKDCEALKGFLLSEYDQYFRELYGEIITEGLSMYTISTYYLSWKLRGDHPLLYISGRFENFFFPGAAYMANEHLEGGFSFRNEREPVLLMYYYHYSINVRKKGARPLNKKVSDMYIKGVKKVQRAMQQYVARCGISIEANPSSNYKISTIDRYEQHPILKLYNMGLTWDEKKLRECPQLHVSINTDDKGIFDTSLENEFALMGCALEQMKDNEGQYIYPKQMVYDWLERIRQNGNQQSFLERNNGQK